MVAILGPDGKPFSRNGHSDPARLKDNGFALKQVQTFSGLVGGIAKTYRWAFDEALRNSPQNALAMMRDGTVRALLQERQVPTANAQWHLEPEDAENEFQQSISDQLQDIVTAIPRFSRLRYQLLQALWYGRYGTQYAVGKRQVKGQTRFTILNHQPVHGDKFVYRWDGTPGVLISQLYATKYGGGDVTGITSNQVEALKAKGGVVLPTDRGMALFLENPQWRDRFAIHMHVSEDADFSEPELAGGIHGIGLRSMAYWLWWLRQETLSWLLDYLARVGAGGLTLIGFESGNAASLDEARSIGEQLETGNVILVPKPVGDEKLTATIDRVEPSNSGSAILIQLVTEFFDNWLERLIIGQSMSGGADNDSGLGGTGRANLAADTKSQLLQMDAEALDECLTEQLIQPLKRWNFPNAHFRVKFITDLSKPNPDKLLDAASKVFEMGAELVTEEVMSIAGLSMPQPGDETLSQEKMQAAQQPAPGAPGSPPGAPGGDPADQAAQGLFQESMDNGDLFSHEGLNRIKGQLSSSAQPGNPGAPGAAPGGLKGDKGGPVKMQRSGLHFRYEKKKAPKGGITLQGTFYPGGQWIPTTVLESLSEEEQDELADAEDEETYLDMEEDSAEEEASEPPFTESPYDDDKDNAHTDAEEQFAKIAALQTAFAKIGGSQLAKYMGSKGWSYADAKAALQLLGKKVSDNTIKSQLSAGKTGKPETHSSGKVANLGEEMAAMLSGSVGIKPPPTVEEPKIQEPELPKSEPKPQPSQAEGELTKVKSLGGSGDAALWTDATGKKWVIKSARDKPTGVEHLKNEVAVDHIYNMLGVNVVPAVLEERNGKLTKRTGYLEGSKTLSQIVGGGELDAESIKVRDEIAKNFALDALMGNWDVIGQSYDNILVTPDGQVWRIDNGGSMSFRAQGSKKGNAWSHTVGELDSMRGVGHANSSAEWTFGHLTDEQVAKQIDGLDATQILTAASAAGASSEDRSILGKRLSSMKTWAANKRAEAKLGSEPVTADVYVLTAEGGKVVHAKFSTAVTNHSAFNATYEGGGKKKPKVNSQLPEWTWHPYADMGKAAVDAFYSYSGSGASSMNAYLWGKSKDNIGSTYAKHIKEMAKTFAKMKPAEKHFPVYRSVPLGYSDAKDFVAKAKAVLAAGGVHNQFVMKGFSSASTQKHRLDMNVSMLIHTKVGIDLRPISGHASEDEILLPAGAKYKVLKVWNPGEAGPHGKQTSGHIIEVESIHD